MTESQRADGDGKSKGKTLMITGKRVFTAAFTAPLFTAEVGLLALLALLALVTAPLYSLDMMKHN